MLKLVKKLIDESPSANCRKFIECLGRGKFSVDPGSVKHHHSYRHGLLVHSYEVYENLKGLIRENNMDYGDEVAFFIGFGHDLCKVNSYRMSVDGTYSYYHQYSTNNMPSNHGYASAQRVKNVLPEIEYENFWPIAEKCIIGHMGEYGNKYDREFYLKNVDGCPLMWLTNMADMKSSHDGPPREVYDELLVEEDDSKFENLKNLI